MEPSFTFEQRDSDSHFLHFPTRRRRRKRSIVRLASYTEIIIERFTERSSFSTRERKSKSADDETFEIKIRYSRYVRVHFNPASFAIFICRFWFIDDTRMDRVSKGHSKPIAFEKTDIDS